MPAKVRPAAESEASKESQTIAMTETPNQPGKSARPAGLSISRLTQMARARTIDQTSPVGRPRARSQLSASILKEEDDNERAKQEVEDKNNQVLLDESEKRNRLKSQSSVLSFGSQAQKLRTSDPENDKFLRRFATNNDEKDQSELDKVNELDIRYHKLCLEVMLISLSGNYVIDPSRWFHYRWLQLISLAVSYNIIFIIGRGVFWNMHNCCARFWFTCDYLCDLIYLLDMIANSRTGYLEQGILVHDSRKLAQHYLSSYTFKLDILSVLPTDFAYALLPTPCQPNRVPCAVIVRLNRLFRFHRLAQFFERTESATNFPLIFRITKLVFYILVIIHWNACIYFAVSYLIGFGTDRWVYQPALTAMSDSSLIGTPINNANNNNQTIQNVPPFDDKLMVSDPLVHQYIYCFYWSTLTLTTIGEVPMPERDGEYLFVVVDLLIGLLIFATIVGNIGSMITSMNAARAEFQHRMDSVKQWMKFRKVNKELEERIIRWFDYLWANRQTLDEDAVTAILPDRLKAETAIHVHLETLKRVQLFQDCEPGLLVQLVLKLKLQVFSPGDYICRVGDVGKEMYIVKRGELNVLSEDCSQVYGKLTDGSVFGELSILNISGVKTGNRRTANVRSVGYSDLFALSKQDLWQVLEDYPDAKSMLIDRGKEILRKDGLLLEADDLSKSTPVRVSDKNATSSESRKSSCEDTTTSRQCKSKQADLDQAALLSNHNPNSGHLLPACCLHYLATELPTRTPSLFGLTGDSSQLEQLMFKFQEQQQQQLNLQHQLASLEPTASGLAPSRSSIIRKRQSLNAVRELQMTEGGSNEPNFVSKSSSQSATRTGRSFRGPVMKKSLSFVLPSNNSISLARQSNRVRISPVRNRRNVHHLQTIESFGGDDQSQLAIGLSSETSLGELANSLGLISKLTKLCQASKATQESLQIGLDKLEKLICLATTQTTPVIEGCNTSSYSRLTRRRLSELVKSSYFLQQQNQTIVDDNGDHDQYMKQQHLDQSSTNAARRHEPRMRPQRAPNLIDLPRASTLFSSQSDGCLMETVANSKAN